MSVTRTMQARENKEWVDGFFENEAECEFPLPFVPRQEIGDYLYIIYQGVVAGRCRILRCEPRNEPVEVGSEEQPVDARSVIIVQCPGEPAPREIRRQGHMSIRYIGEPGWNL